MAARMTDDAAAIVYDEIQKTDVLTGAKYISFAEGVEQGPDPLCGRRLQEGTV